MKIQIVLFLWLALPALSAHAFDRFSRQQAVLDHFGVPEESSSQPVADALHGKQTLSGFQKILKFADSTATFSRFADWDSTGVRVYQDVDTKKVEDFRVAFAAGEEELAGAPDDFTLRLQAAAMNPADQALRGLRVAIDPGHMGGEVWDKRTGKYASDGQGHIVSEGKINLQVALLLEERLRNLGAEVLITHRELGTVSDEKYENYNLRPWALWNLKESALESWFSSLLGTAAPGAELYSAFSHSQDFKDVFSESKRAPYYIRGVDLQARVDKIDAFQPDLVVIIHFDTNDRDREWIAEPTTRLQGFDATKVFVAGGYMNTEFGSREDRIEFSRHSLNAASWNASVDLSRRIAHALHERLGVALENNGSSANTREIEPGVFARNLYIPAHLTTPSAVSYAECLFYDNADEFRALLRADHTMVIGGVRTTYSHRLVEVTDAFESAITSFVKN